MSKQEEILKLFAELIKELKWLEQLPERLKRAKELLDSLQQKIADLK